MPNRQLTDIKMKKTKHQLESTAVQLTEHMSRNLPYSWEMAARLYINIPNLNKVETTK